MTTKKTYKVKRWTDREDRRLKGLRESGMTWVQIGEVLRRSPVSCKAHWSRQGFVVDTPIPLSKRYWTDEQDAMLIAGIEALSEIIGRPPGAVASHVMSLLTSGHFRETTVEIAA